ncbi:hypothetical protein Ocin01_20074 [Orchesella cincta]|uniref:Uncharacterized protein n=1 Tax=Orchesella cincta TaxID=48709 RepID=A0A1D2M0W6_ORCCI|nr:hypothetical protein Ocin01_20074 [Orchesella cincta]
MGGPSSEFQLGIRDLNSAFLITLSGSFQESRCVTAEGLFGVYSNSLGKEQRSCSIRVILIAAELGRFYELSNFIKISSARRKRDGDRRGQQ